MKNSIIAMVIRQAFISKAMVLIAWPFSAVLFAQSTPYDSYDGPFNSISAGCWHSVALKKDGAIVQWGRSKFPPPADLAGASPASPGVKAISAGWYHTVALKEDGTIAAWGKEQYGILDIPTDLTNVKAISAGKHHTAALKEDGTVVEWGSRYIVESGGVARVPEGLTNVKAIAIAGKAFTIALKENGTVVAWGIGEINIPADLTNVISITAGEFYAAALKEDGTIVMLGNYDYDPPAGLTNIKAIASGINHMVALREEGTVAVWQAKKHDFAKDIGSPMDLKNVKAIDAGKYHMIALKEDGSVALWGSPQRIIPVNIFKQPENMQAGNLKGHRLLSGNFLSVPKNALATLYNLNGRILAQWTVRSEYELDQTAKATFNGIYIIRAKGGTEKIFIYQTQ